MHTPDLFGRACKGACRWLLCLSLLSQSAVSLGDEPTRKLLVRDGRVLDVIIGVDFDPSEHERLIDWVTYISEALANVLGHWPRNQWEIAITPAAAAGDDPIPWAQIQRNTVDRVDFFIAPRASLEQLKQAWTGYHELAHLLIPYKGWGDSWFSEGLASYYQNIMQARNGMLSEEEAWQRIYDGFSRGRADTEFDGQSLEQVSNTMRINGGYMRVYWSGAWYFLTIDVLLRRHSEKSLSLDTALRRLNSCCADESLPAIEIARKLDELNGVALFETLFNQARQSTRVPEFESIFTYLGINLIEGEVQLDKSGPGAALRQQITNLPSHVE